ncbi:MAG: hypothetical protein ACK46O_08805 [Flavobacteriia bacterium]|jgi:hypothetical protein
MKIQFISCVFLFVSCTSGVKLKAVNLGPLFHDSNSKVWMVDKVIADKQNFAPRINSDKDVIVFYETGKCMYQPMKTLGDFPGKKGEYSLFSEDKTLSLYFTNERWDFKIDALSEDTIVLKPLNTSDLKYSMILVPFPEF